MTEEIQEFETGAVRSSDANNVRYDLVPIIGLRRVAETCKEGSVKYSDWNWLKGFPCSDVLNHCMRHIELWRSGDTLEDHLAHAAWNLMVLMEFEETRPDLMDIPSRVQEETNKDAIDISGQTIRFETEEGVYDLFVEEGSMVIEGRSDDCCQPYDHTKPFTLSFDISYDPDFIEHIMSDDCCNVEPDCLSVSSEVDDDPEDWQEAREEFDKKFYSREDIQKMIDNAVYWERLKEDKYVCRCDEELY